MNTMGMRRSAPLVIGCAIALIAAATGSSTATPLPSLVAPTTTLVMPVRPAGLAVDAAGSVYVAGYGEGTNGDGTEVSVFDPGVTTRNEVRTLKGLHSPWDVAIHPSTGDVFVSNYTASSISVFAPGQTSAKATLTGVRGPTGLAFDNAGRLLVASAVPDGGPMVFKVYAYALPGTTPSDEFLVTGASGGIEVDPLWNRLYVTHPWEGYGGLGLVEVVDIATKHTLSELEVTDGLYNPMDIALQQATGTFFVTEWAGGSSSRVAAFPRGRTLIDSAISLGPVTGPWGLAVRPADGAVLVSDNVMRVRVFPPVAWSVSGVDPSHGPVTGGTVVSVNGTNLGAVTSVTFNGVPAEGVGPVLPGTIPVRTPAMASAGPVTVEVHWGTSLAGRASAFTYDPMAPGPATGVTATPGNGRVDVTWTAPAFTGGVPVQGYVVTPSPGGAPCSTTERDCTISGLTNGQKYKFTVTTTNTAGLTSVSEPSAEVAPYVPIKRTVKAKKATSKLPRKGNATIVNWVKKPKYSSLAFTNMCFVPQGFAGAELTSAQLCTFTTYKTGKVKVRTKGYKNVRVQVSVQAVPKAGAPVKYGPSTTWTRTWRVR